jgi:hypothetical protein
MIPGQQDWAQVTCRRRAMAVHAMPCVTSVVQTAGSSPRPLRELPLHLANTI